jgi:hypothetical protein
MALARKKPARNPTTRHAAPARTVLLLREGVSGIV